MFIRPTDPRESRTLKRPCGDPVIVNRQRSRQGINPLQNIEEEITGIFAHAMAELDTAVANHCERLEKCSTFAKQGIEESRQKQLAFEDELNELEQKMLKISELFDLEKDYIEDLSDSYTRFELEQEELDSEQAQSMHSLEFLYNLLVDFVEREERLLREANELLSLLIQDDQLLLEITKTQITYTQSLARVKQFSDQVLALQGKQQKTIIDLKIDEKSFIERESFFLQHGIEILAQLKVQSPDIKGLLQRITENEVAAAQCLKENVQIANRISALEMSHRKMIEGLEVSEKEQQGLANSLDSVATELRKYGRKTQQILRRKKKRAARQSMFKAIATIGAITVGGFAFGIFKGAAAAGQAAAAGKMATTASATGMNILAKQAINIGISYGIEKTIGKTCPPVASIARGIGGALTGNVSSMGDVLKDTAKHVMLDQANKAMREIGGERLASFGQIVLNTASKGVNLLSNEGVSTVVKNFAVDEVARQATKKMDPSFAPIAGTLIRGVGGAAIHGLKGEALKEHSKSTLFSMMGQVGSGAIKDPGWRNSVSGYITQGLQEYSDETARIRFGKAERAAAEWQMQENRRQKEEQQWYNVTETKERRIFSDNITAERKTKEASAMHGGSNETLEYQERALEQQRGPRRIIIQNPAPKVALKNPIGEKKPKGISGDKDAKPRSRKTGTKPKITSSASLLNKMPKDKNFTLHYQDGFEYEFYPEKQKIVERTPSGEQYTITKKNPKEFERAYKKLAKIGGEIVKEDATLRIRAPHSGPTLEQPKVFRLTAAPKTNNYEILFNNGIHYTQNEFKEALQQIHEYSGGHNVTGIYQDYGKFSQWGPHVSNTVGNRCIGNNSSQVSDFISFELSKNPNKQFLLVNHSMGGATAKGAIQNLTPCQQAQVTVIDVAPAGYSNEPGLRKNTAIVHGQDFVNQFDARGRKEVQKQGKLIDVTNSSSKKKFSLLHHSFDDRVYEHGLKKEIASFVDSCEKNKHNQMNPVSSIQNEPPLQRTKNMIVANGMNKNEAVDLLMGKSEGVPKELVKALKPVADRAKGNWKASFAKQAGIALGNYAKEAGRNILKEPGKHVVRVLSRARPMLRPVPYLNYLMFAVDFTVEARHLYNRYKEDLEAERQPDHPGVNVTELICDLDKVDRKTDRYKEDLEAESWLYYPK